MTFTLAYESRKLNFAAQLKIFRSVKVINTSYFKQIGWGSVSYAAWLACCPLAALADEPWPTAQLAPTGYSAAINSPTADVLPWGGAGLSLSNSNPERARKRSDGSFGSINAGFGLLPGLELVGRLAYEGDLDCNLYYKPCAGGQRDLSVSAKYQLPIELPLDTRLAVGFTDYGGAATSYRSYYGVATSTWGPLDLSLGYGRPKSATALLDGGFGSVVLRLDDHWAAALEHDSREARLGLNYLRPLGRDLALRVGASRKLTDSTGQQAWQMNAALNWVMGQTPEPFLPRRAPAAPMASAGADVAASPWSSTAPFQLVPQPLPQSDLQPSSLAPLSPQAPLTAEGLAQALQASGFAQISVRHSPAQSGQPALWQVRAESRRWRQSQIDALGAALAAWLKPVGATAADELLLTLTYQREPVLHAYTNATCLDGWLQGWTRCAGMAGMAEVEGQPGRALWLSRDGEWPAAVQARLQSRREAASPESAQQAFVDAGPAWLPQFEIGPGLRTAVGTELGLFDYSLALELGTEVNLAPGLFWQGVLSAPMLHSNDFKDGQAFAGYRPQELGFDSSLLSYWKALPHGVAAQASAGYIDRNYRGGMVEGLWMTEDGRWRLSATAGRFEHEITAARQTPLLGSARWSLVPGAWQLEATAGRFLGGDQGYNLASHHWFGDTMIRLFYRDTQGDAGTAMAAQRKFVGFTLSLPLGPKAAQELGPVTLRGSDRFAWGLQTKVGDKDNILTQGYGEQPRARHGLRTDVTDFDRNGRDDMLANSARLRAVLAQQLAAPR